MRRKSEAAMRKMKKDIERLCDEINAWNALKADLIKRIADFTLSQNKYEDFLKQIQEADHSIVVLDTTLRKLQAKVNAMDGEK